MADPTPQPPPSPEPKPTTEQTPPSPESSSSPEPDKSPEAAASLIGKDEPKADKKPAEGEPIKYENFKLPEGVELDPEGMKAFTDILGPAKVSQETGQALVDLFVKNLQAAQADTQKGMTDAWVATRNKWTEEVKADPEIGGNNLPVVTATIAKALDQFGDKGVREALTMTGADNNPAIIRTLYKMSKALTEGNFVQGTGPQKTPQTAAERLYGVDGPKKGLGVPTQPS